VSEPRWEWIAGLLLGATYAVLEVATTRESWWLLVLALAIPIVFSIVRLLAADPRSDWR
jgi:hypothetical protein